ncbi:hypothetical protein HHK36_027155 [Tetracentron sinense]|uniref:Xyloglucan endotransglucosylase/hydrolase n=1 Tax=Tetracentron sinense TaxID=13715 RepID=A0A835D2W2_TETSI|nr:hypothetical protein HHK36_027155 [Tetracentron sinense]
MVMAALRCLTTGQLLRLSLDKLSGSLRKNRYTAQACPRKLGQHSHSLLRDYLLKGLPMMKSISSSWGTLVGTLRQSTLTCSAKGRETGSSSFTCGLTPPRISTPIPSSGTPSRSLDSIPIREYKNAESMGVPFPKNRPMRIYSSLWNADDWATRGGLVKTDWTKAPFTAFYRNFNANACVWSSGASSCGAASTDSSNNAMQTQELDSTSRRKLRWARKNYIVYNYCTDLNRFPQGIPPECRLA